MSLRPLFRVGIFIALVSVAGANVRARSGDDNEVITRVRRLVEEVKTASYPELKDADIQIKLFNSASDYFQTRFTVTSFLFRPKLRYLLKVNRRLFDQAATEAALRAILAHELGHILAFKSKARWRLLALVQLPSPVFTARFERRTDLLAIARGYGVGLKAYREWLYQHIPARKLTEKKRNYFSPAEIDALLHKMQTQPERLKSWLKHPPRSLPEIEP